MSAFARVYCLSAFADGWAHQNRLGSVVAVSDAAGAVVEKYTYSAYGESGNEGDGGFPFRFTGQKLDAETGLYYYKARYYDPETGRFLQTDPIGYRDQMNLYAYVGNDPVNASDPTGECGVFIGGCIGAVFGAVFGGGAALISELRDDKPGVRLGKVGLGALKGGVSGAIIGQTGNVAAGAAAAAAIGVVEGGVNAAGKEGATAVDVIVGAAGQGTVDFVSTFAGGAAGKAVGGAIAGELAGNITAAIIGTGTQAVVNGVPGAADAVSSAAKAGIEAAAPAVSDAVDSIKNMGDNFQPPCTRQEDGC